MTSWHLQRNDCVKLKRFSQGLDSIVQLQDLVGARLVVLFRRDANKLCALIADTFKILKREDTALRLKEDRFGYSSVHLLIKLPDEWLSVPSLNSLGDLKAEIQVRTMAQHIWAASSHVLQYKNESNVPLPVRRSIHRVSALLETVDVELERVLTDRETYSAELNVSSQEPLNVDSLRKLLDSLLPPLNKVETDNYSVLLQELNDFGVRDIGRLRQIIAKHLSSTLEMDRKTAQEYREKLTDPSMRQRADAGAYFLHSGLVRHMMSIEFGPQWQRYMLGIALKYLPANDPRRSHIEKEFADLTDQ